MKNLCDGYVYFGEYPQTIKANEVEITDIQDNRGYFLGSDGFYYARVISRPYYCVWTDKDSTDNERIVFRETIGDKFYPVGRGHSAECEFKLLPINSQHKYRFSNSAHILPREEYFFKVEKILWNVLSDSNGTRLLLSDKVLDTFPFSFSFNDGSRNFVASSSFKDSVIRMWLNGYTDDLLYRKCIKTKRKELNQDFFNHAFNELEKKAILETIVNNSIITTNKGVSHVSTKNSTDKVFLLSYADTINPSYGFTDESNGPDIRLEKNTTDFSRAIGVMINGGLYGSNAQWWLRSAKDTQMASVVNFNGSSNNSGFISRKAYGVVPAIVVNSAMQIKINDEHNEDSAKVEARKKEATKRLKQLKKNIVHKESKVKEELIVPERKDRVFETVFPNGRLYYDYYYRHDYTEGSKHPSYSGIYDEENRYYDASDTFDDINEYLNNSDKD